jgi:hypothetical protein
MEEQILEIIFDRPAFAASHVLQFLRKCLVIELIETTRPDMRGLLDEPCVVVTVVQ